MPVAGPACPSPGAGAWAGRGRALLHGVLGRFGEVPVTLTAARAGGPRYDSLGFIPVTDATRWG